MAKDKADGKTVDFVSGKAGQTKTADERREYLRLKKRESRLRQRREIMTSFHTDRAAEITDQVTLTLSTGAKAILQQLAKEQNSSMTLVVENLLMHHRKAPVIRAKMPGLFPKG